MNFKALKVPAIGLVGVGTGISVGTLSAEFTSRVTGQKGWAATGIKAGVKGLVGIASYLGAGRISDRHTASSFFLEMLAYGSWGSIFLDLVAQLYPGGFIGMAEDWAVTTKVYAMGSRKVAGTLNALERASRTQGGASQAVAASIF